MVALGALLSEARRHLGKPYVLGATGDQEFDCSSLVQLVYGRQGVKLPRLTWDQVQVGAAVSIKDIQAGDLVFSSWDGIPHSHVAIAFGDGTVLSAPAPGQKVSFARLDADYLKHVDAVRRVTADQGDDDMSQVLIRIAGDKTGAVFLVNPWRPPRHIGPGEYAVWKAAQLPEHAVSGPDAAAWLERFRDRPTW